MSPAPSYRETQTYTTLWLILCLTAVVLLPFVLPDRQSGRLSVGLLFGLSTGVGLLLMGRLTVSVDDQAVRWQFGYVGWPAWEQPLAELSHTDLARGTRFGSGIKGSAKHREYHVQMHSPGVRLYRHDGRTVLLGSAQPERLKASIDAHLDSGIRG